MSAPYGGAVRAGSRSGAAGLPGPGDAVGTGP